MPLPVLLLIGAIQILAARTGGFVGLKLGQKMLGALLEVGCTETR